MTPDSGAGEQTTGTTTGSIGSGTTTTASGGTTVVYPGTTTGGNWNPPPRPPTTSGSSSGDNGLRFGDAADSTIKHADGSVELQRTQAIIDSTDTSSGPVGEVTVTCRRVNGRLEFFLSSRTY